MSILKTLSVILVALEFFYIMYLETLATTSSQTAKLFGISQEKLADKELNTLFKNQGIYNGLLGLGLLFAIGYNVSLIIPILIYIILVATYGAITSHPKILLNQGGLALLALVLQFLPF